MFLLEKHPEQGIFRYTGIFLLLAAIVLSGCIGHDNTTDTAPEINNSIGIKFVLIPEGEFYMGSNSTPIVAFDDPLHKVTIGKAFYMSECEVTQQQWEKIMGDNPSYFKGDDLPVENVSWDEAQEFINRLNQLENTDKYRLPSEAEWEYACRAGTNSDFFYTEYATDMDNYGWSESYGWCAINSNGTTHAVGLKKANTWGLYDMHGNVWEWVQDSWHADYEGAPDDASAWEDENTDTRVGRGGSWMDGPNLCKSSFRGNLPSGSTSNVLGFRLVKDI